MLKGKISYHDSELDKTVHYAVWGYAFATNISLVLQPLTEDSISYFTDDTDHRVEQTLIRNERMLEITPSNVAVETVLNEEIGKAYTTARVLPASIGIGINLMIRLGTQNYVKIDKHEKDGIVSYSYRQKDVKLDPKSSEPVNLQGYIEYHRDNTPFNFNVLQFETNTFEMELKEVGGSNTKKLPYMQAKTTVSFKINRVFELMGFTDVNKANHVSIADKGMFLSSLDEVIQRYPNKNLEWIRHRNYTMVTDQNVKSVVKKLLTYPYLAVDTETTGLGITFKSRSFVQAPYQDQLVGVIVSGKEGEAFFFPISMNTVPNLCQGDHVRVMEKYIKPLLQKPTVLFNAAYDAKVFMIYGLQVNILMDVMVALQDTVGYEEGIKRINLKNSTARWLHRDAIEIEELTRTGSYEGANFADVPEELVLSYACPDGDNTLCLYNLIIKTKLLESHDAVNIATLDSHFALCIAYQEFFGQHINVDKLPQLRKDLTDDKEKNIAIMRQQVELLNEWHKELNKNKSDSDKKVIIDMSNFNPNSVQQMLKIVYEGFELPQQTKFDANKRRFKATLDKKARKDLLKTLDRKKKNEDLGYVFIKAYKDYNDSNTMVKTFTKNLSTLMSPDGYTFSAVNQFLNTGRLSTNNPPYQNYSKPVKKYIVPRPGFGLSDNDFQSIEYKVIAGLSQEKRLLDAFQDPNTDYHRLQASTMYQIPYELITDDQRSAAKKFNFGIPFGMGEATLGERLRGERNAKNTAYAHEMMKRYFAPQPHVKAFFEGRRDFAVKHGFSRTLFGRRRYYDKRRTSVGSIRRKAGNQPIQGTAADMFKLAVVRLYYTILKQNLFGKVLLVGFIHDEMLIEVHKSIHPIDWLRLLKSQVELRLPNFPPAFLGWGYGSSWYEAKVFDIPTELQNELLKNGAEKEYPNWDGDCKKFNDWLLQRIDRFEKDEVRRFLTNKDNEGKTMPPVISGYLDSAIEDEPEVKKAREEEEVLPLKIRIDLYSKLYKLGDVVIVKDPLADVNKLEVKDKNDTVIDTTEIPDDDEDSYQQQMDEDEYKRRQIEYERKQMKKRVEVFGDSIDQDKHIIIFKKDVLMLKLVQMFAKPEHETDNFYLVTVLNEDDTLIKTRFYMDISVLQSKVEPLYLAKRGVQSE